MNNIILSIKNLKKNYQSKNGEIPAVKNFSFELYKGEFVAIVGPSGSGKTTILSILADLLEKTDGKIEGEKDIKIGYMLQQDALFEWRSILSNCLLSLEINNNLNKNTQKYVLNLLNKYGLKDFVDNYPRSLSGGMRQRVALIRTLANNPDILLLDEPFSALDYQTRLSVGDDVYKMIKAEKKSAIMVTHDLAEAISMADRIIVLSKRPSEIKNIYNIHLNNRDLPSKVRHEKKFYDYYNLIWKDIDKNV